MYCFRKVTDDLTWVGGNDRRLAMFEGVYSVPNGVSYNSYLLNDEKTVLFDTVDKAVEKVFFENVAAALDGRALDYVVVHHMEPDHSATLEGLILRYPDVKVICNAKILGMIKQFFDFDIDSRAVVIKEGDTFNSGRHEFTFVMAPMVHWPEVMVSYDKTDGILFSADAFGTFGALNGALFADEVDFARDYLDEARRYYTNIVGKYGVQVQALLKKAAGLKINMICPLHGFVWRKDIGYFVDKYDNWSSYTPEETGVMIAYASVYGNTENTAEILSCCLHEKGIKTVMFDVSVTPASEIVAAAFKYSHFVFASTTYNAGIFVNMESFLHDLTAHNIQNRTVAIIENGSWAATSGKLIRAELEKCKNITFIENMISLKSSLKPSQLDEIDAMANQITDTIVIKNANVNADAVTGVIQNEAMFKLSYGLFLLSANDNGKDNGCIINTVTQITDNPKRISVAVNKINYTHDMIVNSGTFNISVLTTDTPFEVFEQFGFKTGENTDKFAGINYTEKSSNGINYLNKYTNAVISAKVVDVYDYGTHTVFIAEITEAFILDDVPSVTYSYYFEHIKPKPNVQKNAPKGYVCKICGYVHEGDELPDDFICPLCKHGKEDFEKMV